MPTSVDGVAEAGTARGRGHPSLHGQGRVAWLAAVAGTAAITLSALGATGGTALAAQRHAQTVKSHAHTTKAAEHLAVKVASVSKYGKVLVDQNGLALYYDTANKPPKKWPCKGACLAVWRPLVPPKGQAPSR